MGVVEQRVGVPAEHVLGPVAEHLRRRPVDEGAEALHVDPVDALARRFEQQACPFLGLPHRGLGPPLGVDVGVHPDPLPDAAPLVQDGDGPDEHVQVLAVVPPQPVFHLIERAGGHGRRPGPRGVRPVVGVDGVEPARALELVERLAGELGPAGLLGLELAGRRGVPDDRRGGLDQGPEPFLPRRKASSARFVSVMSREMPNVPTMRPSSSRSGIRVVETHDTGRRPAPLHLADHGLPVSMTACSSSRPAGVLLGEEVEVRLAHRLGGVVQPNRSARALLIRMKRPSASLK